MKNPGPATRPTPSNLCGLCLGIFSTLQGLQALVSNVGYKHHRRQELIGQSEAGCELCRLLHRRSVLTGAPDPPDDPVWTLYAFPDFDLRHSADLMDKADERTMALSSSHPFKVKALENIRALSRHSVLWIQTVTEDEDPAAPFVGGRPRVTKVDSTEVHQHVRSWIDSCQNGHESCPPVQDAQLPSLVVSVGSGAGRDVPRLHASHHGERARYAALSYCWGEDYQPYMTRKGAVLEAYQNELPYGQLGQTIRDAISTARSIGLAYLWVDVLCIVQDDAAQKEREIRDMHNIFMRSTVTITAARARDASSGFLGGRAAATPAARCPFYVPDTDDAGLVSLHPHEWVDDHEAVDARAWYLEEAVLSPRRLVYGARELLWDCPSRRNRPLRPGNVHNLGHVKPLPPEAWAVAARRGSVPGHWPHPAAYVPPAAQDRAAMWGAYVKDYTARRLTKARDQPVAIRGIAAVLEGLHGAAYRAELGVFGGTDTLPYLLNWRLALAVERRGYERRYGRTEALARRPGVATWSWLSLNAAVDFNFQLAEVHARVVWWDADAGTGQQQQQQQQQQLRLEAKLMPVGDIPQAERGRWSLGLDDGSPEGEVPRDGGYELLLLGYSAFRLYTVGILVRCAGEDAPGCYRRLGWFSEDLGANSEAGLRQSAWKDQEVKFREIALI